MTSGITNGPSPIQDSLEMLHLELRGDRPCITSYHTEYTQESNGLVATAPSRAPIDNPIKTSITALNKDLDGLAIITRYNISGGLPQLKADLCEQAEVLATHMAFPKVMRILTIHFRNLR